MKTKLLALGAALSLAGCVVQTAEGPPNIPPVSVIGTPVLIVAKVPACATTIILGAPLAAASAFVRPDPVMNALSPSPGADVRREVNDALINNCGPPYAVTLDGR